MQIARVAASLPRHPELRTPADLRSGLDAALETGQREGAAWEAAHDGAWTPAELAAFAQATVPHPPTDIHGELSRMHRMQAHASPDAKRAAEWLSSTGQPSGKLDPASWWTQVLTAYGAAAIAAHGPTAGARDAAFAADLVQRTLRINDDATFAAKYALPERRPYTYAKGATPPSGGWAGQDLMSHPSGHTSRAFATALVLGRLWPSHANELLDVARGVAHSRLLEDMHFPHDVELGARIGATIASVTLAGAGRLPVVD
ncbi:MAG: phosphoesterase [Thermoleophilia bacterium]|nr:phosphoesterase [Thermoleophilia bacterium]